MIRFLSTETIQGNTELGRDAKLELQSVGGANVSLEAVARQALGPGATDAEVQAAIGTVEKHRSISAIRESLRQFAPASRSESFRPPQEISPRPLTPDEADAIKVIQRLNYLEAGGPQSPVINYYENNRRMIVPGAEAQQRARVNGESRARDAELP